DGASIFVAGSQEASGSPPSQFVLRLATLSGNRVWIAVPAPGSVIIGVDGMALARDGSSVFVTGTNGDQSHPGYATVAYNGVTGARRWSVQSPGTGQSVSSDVALNPAGTLLFVAGF